MTSISWCVIHTLVESPSLYFQPANDLLLMNRIWQTGRNVLSDIGLQNGSLFLLVLPCFLSFLFWWKPAVLVWVPNGEAIWSAMEGRFWPGAAEKQILRSTAVRHWVLLSIAWVILEANPPLVKASGELGALADTLTTAVWYLQAKSPG